MAKSDYEKAQRMVEFSNAQQAFVNLAEELRLRGIPVGMSEFDNGEDR